jgi:hypothetical protein
MWYRLNGKIPEPSGILEWDNDNPNWRVAMTEAEGVKISTVFLGLDHSFGGSVPILFETMVFGGEHDGYQERYATWEEAEAGHALTCRMVFNI